MPSTCPAVEVQLIKSGYHNPGYFVFARITYISDNNCRMDTFLPFHEADPSAHCTSIGDLAPSTLSAPTIQTGHG